MSEQRETSSYQDVTSLAQLDQTWNIWFRNIYCFLRTYHLLVRHDKLCRTPNVTIFVNVCMYVCIYLFLFIYFSSKQCPHLGLYHPSVVEPKLFFLGEINVTLFISTCIYRNLLIRIRNYSEASVHFKNWKKMKRKALWTAEQQIWGKKVLGIIIRHLSPSISWTYPLSKSFEGHFHFFSLFL